MVTDKFYQKLKVVVGNREYEISIADKNIKQIINIADNIFKTINLENIK